MVPITEGQGRSAGIAIITITPGSLAGDVVGKIIQMQ